MDTPKETTEEVRGVQSGCWKAADGEWYVSKVPPAVGWQLDEGVWSAPEGSTEDIPTPPDDAMRVPRPPVRVGAGPAGRAAPAGAALGVGTSAKSGVGEPAPPGPRQAPAARPPSPEVGERRSAVPWLWVAAGAAAALVVLGLVGGAFLLGRSSDEPAAPATTSLEPLAPSVVPTSTTSTTVVASTQPPSNTEPDSATIPDNSSRGPDPMADVDAAKALFVRLATASCDRTQIPDPNGAAVQRNNGSVYRVIDSEGTVLILDTATSTVYSTDGVDGILPGGYNFGCDPSVFLGGADA